MVGLTCISCWIATRVPYSIRFDCGVTVWLLVGFAGDDRGDVGLGIMGLIGRFG